MSTEKFRRQLRHEAERWWTEGLINAELYEKLAERYQFDRLEHEASNHFIAILMGLGGILLGLGVITFVSANWQEWSRAFKMVLLLSVFISVNAAGFYLWRRPSHKRYRTLGQGLLLLGALLLGANMALMSQMFHQSGNAYELMLIWGLGVTAMAYSLRMTALSILACLLMAIGYWMGYATWLSGQGASGWQLLIWHMPLVMGIVFMPLAHWCRSHALYAATALLIALSLLLNLRPLTGWWNDTAQPAWLVTIALLLPPAWLWSYTPTLWHRLRSANRPAPADPFKNWVAITRNMAITFLSILLYVFSFQGLWPQALNSSPPEILNWHPLIDAFVLAIVTGWGWVFLSQGIRRNWQWQERSINSGTIALLLAVTALCFIGNLSWRPFPEATVFAFNVMLFLLAIALIRDGLALGDRSTFWGGMLLLILGIFTRMLEYDTGLLLKSIVFGLCGIGVIVAGLWFERNIRPQHSLHRALR